MIHSQILRVEIFPKLGRDAKSWISPLYLKC